MAAFFHAESREMPGCRSGKITRLHLLDSGVTSLVGGSTLDRRGPSADVSSFWQDPDRDPWHSLLGHLSSALSPWWKAIARKKEKEGEKKNWEVGLAGARQGQGAVIHG